VGGNTSEPGFELTVDAINGVLAVAIRGPLTADTHEPLRECLDSAIRGGRPVVLDLTEATSMEPESVEMLMRAHRRLATRLRVVTDRNGAVHAALRREAVSHVLALHSSRAEALAASGR
jgi:anti-anti-sigma regulatory factor